MVARRLSFYTPGHPPQYGKERWARYENLRVAGFNKQEARQLSRATSPQATSVVQNMVKMRVRLLSSFTAIAKDRLYEGNMARYRFQQYVREWYEKNTLTSKQGRRQPASAGGKPDTMVWYNAVENRMAARRGWKRGEKVEVKDDKGNVVGHYYLPAEHTPPRRNKRVTPLHKGKGNVKAQRARAYRRSKAFNDLLQSGDSPQARQQKRQWIRDLRVTARREPWRDEQLTKQAKRLGFAGHSLLSGRRAKK